MSIFIPNPEIKAAWEEMLDKDPCSKEQIMSGTLPPEIIWWEIERAFAIGYIYGCKKHNDKQGLSL